MTDDTRADDLDHLYLLTVFHYILAVLVALGACFPAVVLAFRLFMNAAGLHGDGTGATEGASADDPALQTFGSFTPALAVVSVALGWPLSICIAFVARGLHNRMRYAYCRTIAAIECLLFPFGTLLGAFSLTVLARDSVRRLFAASSSVEAHAES